MTYDMIAKFDYDAYHDAIVEELELFSNGLKCVFFSGLKGTRCQSKTPSKGLAMLHEDL